MTWKVEREWEGEVCAVLASGPSMTRQVADTVRASGCRSIAVNNQGVAFGGHPAMAPWADILYASDARWWHNHAKEAMAFKGRKVTISQTGDRVPNLIDESVAVMSHGGVQGFDPRPTHLRTGHNSGFAAVHLAIHFGVRRVGLCGFDMHGKRGEHWFGDHAWRRGYRSRYDLFLNTFKGAAGEFLARAEVVNCSPGSALKCFPFMELREALNGLPDLPEAAPETAAAAAPAFRSAGPQAATGAA